MKPMMSVCSFICIVWYD